MEENVKPDEKPSAHAQQFSEFVSLAVHDLDSPLRKLSVFIEKLSTIITKENNDAAFYIERINSCVVEMRSLVSSLAELDAMSPSKRYVSCNIAAIAQEVLNELTPIIKEKKATIRLSSLPLVQGIHDQYYLLFKKLLENSLTFGRPGTPVIIDLSAEKIENIEMKKMGLDKNKNWYRVTIQDNGIGFIPADANKIFEPFGRLHGKSAYPGPGLGLTIAKKIIENHQGRIFAEGVENNGSRFLLIIPEKPD
jgi:signal transduction histidine kinase